MTSSVTDFTTYLIDLDGVIYRGEELLAGAKEFINWLESNKKKYLFITNNSFANEAQIVAKLKRIGILTDEPHVLAATQAAVKYITHRFPKANVYIVGEQSLFDLVRANGLQIANQPANEPLIKQNLNVDVVLVGLDRTFNYKKLTEAILAVRAGAAFIAINRDSLLPIAEGLIAGCGTMAAAIQAGCGVEPEIIGKPQPTMLQEAMRLLGSRPEETIMIGDGLETDILAGKAAGTSTLLVLTGKDSRENIDKTGIAPDYVYESLATINKSLSL